MTSLQKPAFGRKKLWGALAATTFIVAATAAYAAKIDPNEVYHRKLNEKLQNPQVTAVFKEYGLYANLADFDKKSKNVEMEVGLLEKCTDVKIPLAQVTSSLSRKEAVKFLSTGYAQPEVTAELVTGNILKGNLDLKRSGVGLKVSSDKVDVGIGQIGKVSFNTEIGDNFYAKVQADQISTIFVNAKKASMTFSNSPLQKGSGLAATKVEINEIAMGEIPLVGKAEINSSVEYQSGKAQMKNSLEVTKIGLPQGELRSLSAQMKGTLENTTAISKAFEQLKAEDKDCSIAPEVFRQRHANAMNNAILASIDQGLSFLADFKMEFADKAKASSEVSLKVKETTEQSPSLGERAEFSFQLNADSNVAKVFTNLAPATIEKEDKSRQLSYTYAPGQGFLLNGRALETTDPMVLQLLTESLKNFFTRNTQNTVNDSNH